MERPAFGWVLVGWLCLAGAGFLALFQLDATDDFAGWIPVTVAVQVPAFLALYPAPPGPAGLHRRLTFSAGVRRWGLALPAALVAGIGVFWTMVPIGCLIWEPTWLELRPMLLALGVGFVAVIAAGAGFGQILRDIPHPRGTRFVLLVVTGLGVVGVGSMALRFGTSARYQAEWLVVAIPVIWALPLWGLHVLEPPPESPIPRAIVSR